MVREIITLNVGEAGINLGETIWEQYNMEHNIAPDGMNTIQDDENELVDFYQLNYYEEKYIPRNLMIDSDTDVIENLATSKYHKLYPTQHLLSCNQNASGCFAYGHYKIGKEMIDDIKNALRLMAEDCDNLHGFIMNHSVGGGTGSGLGSLILETIHTDYRKKPKFGFEIYPFDNNSSNCSVEPYNALLSTHWLLDYTEISYIFDNRKIADIYKHKLFISQPNYFHLNSIIAKIVAGITGTLRFSEESMMEMNDIHNHLVPFPRLHFITSSIAPLINPHSIIENKKILVDGFVRQNYVSNQEEVASSSSILRHYGIPNPLYQDIMNMIYKIYDINYKYDRFSMQDFSQDMHDYDFFSIECSNYDPEVDPNIKILLNYRYKGDIRYWKDIDPILRELSRNKVSFLGWSASWFKAYINKKQQFMLEDDVFTIPKSSGVMSGNNTCIRRFFQERICDVYDKMYSQRAFVHWFVDAGMEEGEFAEAREDLGFLQKDYLDTLPGWDGTDESDEYDESD